MYTYFTIVRHVNTMMNTINTYTPRSRNAPTAPPVYEKQIFEFSPKLHIPKVLKWLEDLPETFEPIQEQETRHH